MKLMMTCKITSTSTRNKLTHSAAAMSRVSRNSDPGRKVGSHCCECVGMSAPSYITTFVPAGQHITQLEASPTEFPQQHGSANLQAGDSHLLF